MNFDFSDDQKQLRDQARRYLAEHSAPKAVRAILDGSAPYDRALWKGLAEMGFLGVAVPEEFGGAGAGHLELCDRRGNGPCAGAGAVLVLDLSGDRSDHARRQSRAETEVFAGPRVGRNDRHAGTVRRTGQSVAHARSRWLRATARSAARKCRCRMARSPILPSLPHGPGRPAGRPTSRCSSSI